MKTRFKVFSKVENLILFVVQFIIQIESQIFIAIFA